MARRKGPKLDKERTLREYVNGTAKSGRYYDSIGNSWDAGLFGKTKELDKIRLQASKQIVKNHTQARGPRVPVNRTFTIPSKGTGNARAAIKPNYGASAG